jgi:alpha-ribazole phosphatase
MTSYQLHLLRHGAPERPGLFTGRTDASPDAEGLALCVAKTRDLAFTRVIASDLVRARAPAEEAAAGRGTPLVIDPRWRELDFGDWEGRAAAEIPEADLSRFWSDPELFPPPGGETWSAIRDRVGAALADLPPEDALIIAHGGSIRAALGVLFDFSHTQVWACDLPYAGLISLRVWPGEPRVAQIIGLRT